MSSYSLQRRDFLKAKNPYRHLLILNNIARKSLPSFIYNFFSAKEDDFVNQRYFFSIVFGYFLGFIFYWFILSYFSFSYNLNRSVMTFSIVIIGLVYSYSCQFRAIVWLTLPTLFGRVGKYFIVITLLTTIAKGPITKTSNNGVELARSTACYLKVNLQNVKERTFFIFENSRILFKQLFGEKLPFKKQVEEIKNEFNSFKEDLYNGSSGNSEENWHKALIQNFDTSCEAGKQTFLKVCANMVKTAYNECNEKIFWFLCSQVIKEDKICKFPGADFCSNDMGKGNLKKLFDGITKSLEALEKNVDSNIETEVSYKKPKVDLLSPLDVLGFYQESFSAAVTIGGWILSVLEKLLVLIFLLAILTALSYNSNYLEKIAFDNFYMTPYFYKIDERRRKKYFKLDKERKGRLPLLPLKGYEKRELIDIFSTRRAKKEKSQWVTYSVLIFFGIAIVIIYYLDYLLSFLLQLIGKYSEIEYTQQGLFKLDFYVNGTNKFANFTRNILDAIKLDTSFEANRSNKHCLPKPEITQWKEREEVAAWFAALCVLNFIFPCILRVRVIICAFFYRKRQKERILYLYNDYLKQRACGAEFQKAKLRRMASKQQLKSDENFLDNIWMGSWLRSCLRNMRIGLWARKCCICDEEEMERNDFRACRNCSLVYCEYCARDCEEDGKKKCAVCNGQLTLPTAD